MKNHLNPFSLYLIVFIDATGLGILFPILNSIIYDKKHSIISISSSFAYKSSIYSIVVGIFFLSWFLGATYISKLSDKFGRKRSLLLCAYGLLIGYVLAFISILYSSITLLIISRVVAGFTAASQPIAQATVIDLSNKNNLLSNLSKIMASFSLGMIAGPLLTASLTIYLPIYFPFILISIFCLITTIMISKSSISNNCVNDSKLKLRDIIFQFAIIFDSKGLFITSLAFFFMQFAFNTFYIFISVYMFKVYGFSSLGNSINMFVMGLFMCVSNTIIIKQLTRFNKQYLIIFSTFFMSIFTGLIYIKIPTLSVLSCGFFMIFFAIAYTCMLESFSSLVDDSKQGWIMGITVSIFTLGSFISSMVTHNLLSINSFLIICIIFYLTASFLIFLKGYFQ